MYKTACPKKTTDNTEHQAEDKKRIDVNTFTVMYTFANKTN